MRSNRGRDEKSEGVVEWFESSRSDRVLAMHRRSRVDRRRPRRENSGGRQGEVGEARALRNGAFDGESSLVLRRRIELVKTAEAVEVQALQVGKGAQQPDERGGVEVGKLDVGDIDHGVPELLAADGHVLLLLPRELPYEGEAGEAEKLIHRGASQLEAAKAAKEGEGDDELLDVGFRVAPVVREGDGLDELAELGEDASTEKDVLAVLFVEMLRRGLEGLGVPRVSS